MFLFLTALLVLRLLRLPLLGWHAGLVLVSIFCFTPALQCLVDGQITILLLLLWAAGMILYQEDQELASAAVFALATAIKLTPAIVLLPFLLWRKWKFSAAFLGTLVCLGLLSLAIDTPHALATYFSRVLPAMSGAIPYSTNYSLAAATQRFVTLLRTGSVPPFPSSLPSTTVLIGRLVTIVFTVVLLGLIARTARNADRRSQLLVLGLLSLMAPVLSPVSWFHAYATAFIGFAVLWYDCFQRPVSSPYLLALTFVSLALGSAVSENLISYLIFSKGYPALASLVQIGQLLLAACLVFRRLWELKSVDSGTLQLRRGDEISHPSLPLT